MKISFIALKGMPQGGGIEKYTEEVGSRLANRGHEIVVYTMKHYGAVDGSYKGMNIKTVKTIKRKSLEKIVESFVATCKEIFSNSDIVHFHAFGPSIFCILPRLFGQKTVVQGHGIEWMRSKWGFAGRIFLKVSEYPSIRFAHKVTVVSRVQQSYLKEKYNIESTYIPSGVNHAVLVEPDLIGEYGLKGNDYILFAARLVREKGVHYLIKAYNKLNTNIKLVIAGDSLYEDKYLDELKQMAAENEDIIFLGYATGKLLDELFSNAYLFVLPSELEGLPIALLEAMSYGNCCLVSDIPENLEALNSYGFSFKTKDPGDLTRKLNQLLNNPELVNSIKQNARDCVMEHYSWDKIVDDLEQYYLDLINSKITAVKPCLP